MLDNVLALAMTLLIAWMKQKTPGLSMERWTLDRGEIEAIPDGYYAVVYVELKKLGGEPKDGTDG
jgi:hypothetical protein